MAAERRNCGGSANPSSNLEADIELLAEGVLMVLAFIDRARIQQ